VGKEKAVKAGGSLIQWVESTTGPYVAYVILAYAVLGILMAALVILPAKNVIAELHEFLNAGY
jgi:hypothetical protein